MLRGLSPLVLACVLGACANGNSTPIDGGRRDAFTACTSGLRCGTRCVDVMTDPDNCGGCGRACVVPHATGSCVMGVCGVGVCEGGYSDCNNMSGDGCEQASECRSGATCMTACGSNGTVRCDEACAPSCVAPTETCNLIDDDCDGTCDVGLAGCRTGVHRSVGPSGHFYTTDRTEAACCGMTVETYDFYYLSSIAIDGTQPLFRCRDATGHRLYTTDTGCELAAGEGQMGFIAMTPACGAIALFRLRSMDGDHFYTTSSGERDYAVSIGYVFVGITGYVWTAP